ncbi:alanine/glycine:cation symporter family protein [Brevibacterium sp. 'Marine']|uniref:alanine/glycine:cation symporter family protein n=1 Tax=Brevibacterium sp. 'Marine' TaxID=2725563 RepID=UPI00145D840E|nr:alanine/glycine:cation symporter family protein [Brevibacterium sp. 'Marine']
MDFTTRLQEIANAMWMPVIGLAIVMGLYFTIRTKVLQIRLFPQMLRELKGDGSTAPGGLTPFQALALTIGNRVGVGNIAGVATAVGWGGPGALFWMGVMAFCGGATAFIESTLAQIFKERIDSELKGGVPYYLYKVFQKRWLGMIAAVIALILYTLLAPGIQSNSIAVSVEYAFGIPGWVTGLVVTAVLGIIIWGGRERIVRVVNIIVPIMAVGYIGGAIIVLLVNVTELPAAIGLIISSAFGADQVFGGIVGAAISWGVRRALFSNVAGVGEGTYAAGAAEVSHPAKQGLVQTFSIYIDTLTVCMLTGLMMVVTGQYNVITEDGRELLVNLPGIEPGTNFTQAAVDTVATGFGSPFIAISVAMFAITTIVAFYFIADTNLSFIVGEGDRVYIRILECALLAVCFISCVVDAGAVWAVGDMGYATLGVINFLALIALSGIALKTLKDFDAQRKQGLNPVFDPVKLGIKHANFWEEAHAEAAVTSRASDPSRTSDSSGTTTLSDTDPKDGTP